MTQTKTAMTTNVPFKEGYVKDEWAMVCEPIQRPMEGRAFLWTGRKAEVGQRTETQVTTANGRWCRLSGVVVDVGEMPTLDEWRDVTSSLVNSQPLDRQLSLRDTFIEDYGTLHGQTVTSYSFLNFDFYDRQEELPLKRARVYKVTHVADESMTFVWCVKKIEDVTDTMPYNEFPQAFQKWQEGSRAYYNAQNHMMV